jgi:hypothetical protein
MVENLNWKEWKEKQKRNIFQKSLRKLGLAVFRHKRNHVYCPERFAVKATKLIDIEETPGFGDLAKAVKGQKKTRLDYDKLYMLYQGIWNIRNLAAEPANIAEVGVYQGGGTYFIASAASQILTTVPAIHAFDTFAGHASIDITPQLDGPHQPGKFADTSFDAVQRYLSGFPNVVLHQGRFQDNCHKIAEQSFCFVHLDVDIYKVTLECLEFFETSILIGGIIIVDDYGFKTCEGAKRAVDRFVDDRRNFLKYHLETGQCLLVRLS